MHVSVLKTHIIPYKYLCLIHLELYKMYVNTLEYKSILKVTLYDEKGYKGMRGWTNGPVSSTDYTFREVNYKKEKNVSVKIKQEKQGYLI